MKNIFKILLLVIMISCTPDIPKETPIDKELKGTHILRTFNVRTEKTESWSASYFLITGSAGGHKGEETKVKFSWLNNHNQYVISELPISSIRVEINDTVTIPKVKFRWSKVGLVDDMDYVFKYGVHYMVIVCRERDYPINININEL